MRSILNIYIIAVLLLSSSVWLMPSRVEAAGPWYVDPLGTDDNSTYGTGPGALAFRTIQYAVNFASAGDTINVAAGTYVEQVIINKNITLVGTNAILNLPVSPVPYNYPESSAHRYYSGIVAFGGTAAGGTIGGVPCQVVTGTGTITVRISGFTVDGGYALNTPTYVYGIRNSGIFVRNVSGDLSHNVVRNWGEGANYYSQGIMTLGVMNSLTLHGNDVSGYTKIGIMAAGGVDGNIYNGHNIPPVGKTSVIILDGNTVTGPYHSDLTGSLGLQAPSGIQFCFGATGSVTNNVVTHNGYRNDNSGSVNYPYGGTGLSLSAVYDVLVSGNTIKDNGYPNMVRNSIAMSASGAYTTRVQIQDNTIEGSQYSLIIGTGTENITVERNVIKSTPYVTGAGDDIAVYIYGTIKPTGIALHNNVFYSDISVAENNTALYVASGLSLVNASYNWWGNTTGPRHGYNLGGAGQGVYDFRSDALTYTPWLSSYPGESLWWSKKAINSFDFLGLNPTVTGVITELSHAIALTVPYGTDCSNLSPTISLSGGTVSPRSGVSRNFNSPVTYTVTAADNATTQDYLVTVTVDVPPLSSNKDLTAFSFPQGTGTILGTNVSVTVPYGTNRNGLVATFSITGVSVTVGGSTQTSGVSSNNFNSPVTYRVIAEDSSTKDYTVTVTVALNSAKDITSFSFPEGVGTILGENISVTVPYGTSRDSLTPTIILSGGTVDPLSGVSRNFSNPVHYIVTAEDSSIKDYTVVVTAALNSAKDITSFSFSEGSGTILGENISVTVPYGTNRNGLIPTIVLSGGTVDPLSGVARNFNSSVTYTITAADATQKIYTVMVLTSSNPAKSILSFGFEHPSSLSLPVVGTIDEGEKTIVCVVPYGLDVTSLIATYSITGLSMRVDSTAQNSGVTGNDFSNPVTYTVVAADNSTQNYVVTVGHSDQGRITLIVDPPSSPADDSSSSRVTAIVKDSLGDNVTDGTFVRFTVSADGESWIGPTFVENTIGGRAFVDLTSLICPAGVAQSKIDVFDIKAESDGAEKKAVIFFSDPLEDKTVPLVESEEIQDDGIFYSMIDNIQVTVDATGSRTVSVATYSDNPVVGNTPNFESSGKYYDVHLDNVVGANQIDIKFVSERPTTIYYWSGTTWEKASNQIFSRGEMIVTVTSTSRPSLTDLYGLPFGGAVPPLSPTQNLAYILPIIVVALAIVMSVGLFARGQLELSDLINVVIGIIIAAIFAGIIGGMISGW